MPDTPPPAYDPETILQIKRDATARLLAIPDVVAVGIGPKVIGNVLTGEPAIKVFVRKKLPADQIPPDELIPASIDGIVTDIGNGDDPVPHTLGATAPTGWTGDAVPAEHTDSTTYRPLVGGCRLISTGSNSLGTGGCLLCDSNNPDVGYMLTNYHVAKPSDLTGLSADVSNPGRPLAEQRDQRCFSDVIGTFAGGGMSPDRDEALVRLAPGMKWQAKIINIGVVTGTYAVKQSDVTSSLYMVTKRGVASGLTGGWISAIAATTTNSASDNQLMIQGTPSGSNFKTRFGVRGDSGSVVVNENNEVVGLLYEEEAADRIALAYRIDHVLQRLRDDGFAVDVATAAGPDEVHTVPGAAFAEVPPEITELVAADPAERRAFTGTGNRAPLGRPWFSDVVPTPRTVAGVREDLAGCAAGRELIELWTAYGEELRALIDRNRRVTIAWYRGGGAALMQLILRLPADPSRSLPETLSGVPLMTCVDRLVDAFAREGSAGLADGIRKARALLPDLAGLAYPEIIAALRAKELIPDG